MIKFRLFSLLTLLAMAISTTLYGHGYVISPASRNYRGSLEKNSIGYTYAMAKYGPIINEPQSLEFPKGFPAAGPADGQLASAGGQFGGLLDKQSADMWTKTDISTGVNSFVWKYTAYHATAKWHYYMTKQGWDPNKPITRADLELIGEIAGNNQPPKDNVSHQISIPQNRSGYHVILAVWDIYDTVNAFYNVIDVNVKSAGSPIAAPSAPTGLTSSAVTSSSAKIEWAPQQNIQSYLIYRDGTLLKEVTGVSFEDQGLVANTSYSYQIEAKNSNGQVSTKSQSLTVKTLASSVAEKPSAPSNLHSMGVTENSVSLMWAPSTHSKGIKAYQVFNGTTKIGEVSGTMFNATGLSANTVYSFTVKAVANSSEVSAASNVLSITTKQLSAPAEIPTAPANLHSMAVTETSVSLMWGAATHSQGIKAYHIFNGTTKIGEVSGTMFNVIGLTANTAYSFTVKAVANNSEVSVASNVLSITTKQSSTPAEIPTAPSNLHSMTVTETSVSLMWGAATHSQGIQAYQIFNGTTKIGEVANTMFDVTGLTANTAYSFAVKAVANNGEISVASGILNVTTKATVATPVGQSYCGASVYDATKAYPTAKTKVYYNGVIWESKWYANANEIPGENPVWEEISICTEGPDGKSNAPATYCGAQAYNSARTYANANTKVFYNCKIWVNQWYANPGELPGVSQTWKFVENCTEGDGCNLAKASSAVKGYQNIIVSKNSINLLDANLKDIKEVAVYNVQGVKLKSVSTPKTSSIDISSLPTGVYLINVIYTDGSSVTTKTIR